jgi:ABC-type lipoprotein export system ATPase subunit
VARALANRPSLLLADEPTANIDPRNQQKIVDLIRETCREEGVSLIIVTHALEVAGQFERVDKLEEINTAVASTTPHEAANAIAHSPRC